MDDPYSTLSLSPDATPGEIRRAFRRLARELHPDLNPEVSGTAERFRQITEAYRVLSDPTERAKVDLDPGHQSSASIFQEAGRRWAENGQDVVAVARIDLVTSIAGGPVDVRVTGPVTCQHCAGSGYDPGGSFITCWTCGGTGQVTFTNRMGESSGTCLTCGGEGKQATEECPVCGGRRTVIGDRIVTVELPAAVDEGDTITVRGEGGPGGQGGRPGDLLIFVTFDPHPVYRRRGLDLLVTVPITFTEAALGATITIPTFANPINVRIPPGTQGGTVLAVKGAGVISETGDTGDLEITLHISIPTGMEESHRPVLEELTGTFGSELRSILFEEMKT